MVPSTMLAFVLVVLVQAENCPSPGLAAHSRIVTVTKPFETDDKFPPRAIVEFACNDGYTMFGNSTAVCVEGKWLRDGPGCMLEIARGNPSHMSSLPDKFASPQLSVDGDPHSCVSFDTDETHLVWFVDTFDAHRVRVVKITSDRPLPNATIEIRVGMHHPSTGAGFNTLCTRKNFVDIDNLSGQFLCDSTEAKGRYVSVHILEPRKQHVSLCEVEVYSDSTLSVQDSCPNDAAVPAAARYVFERNCVEFLGDHSNAKALELCKQRGSALAKPTSRALQSFLDFKMARFVEDDINQLVMSYWVDAARDNATHKWRSTDGKSIANVQIKEGETSGDTCVISDNRSWRASRCQDQHQVICIASSKSCGTPRLIESTSAVMPTRVNINDSLEVSCDLSSARKRIQCFPNGTFENFNGCDSTIVQVQAQAIPTPFNFDVAAWIRELARWAKLSIGTVIGIVVGAACVVFSLISGVIWWVCLCFRHRKRQNKISKKLNWSLMSYDVHMRDLPINSSSRIFRTPVNNQVFLTVPKR